MPVEKHDKNLLKKWYKAIDETFGGEILTKDGDSNAICLPIRFAGKAKNINNILEITEWKKKSPSLKMMFYRRTVNESLNEVLDGKKIRVTIEVID